MGDEIFCRVVYVRRRFQRNIAAVDHQILHSLIVEDRAVNGGRAHAAGGGKFPAPRLPDRRGVIAVIFPFVPGIDVMKRQEFRELHFVGRRVCRGGVDGGQHPGVIVAGDLGRRIYDEAVFTRVEAEKRRRRSHVDDEFPAPCRILDGEGTILGVHRLRCRTVDRQGVSA